MTTPPSNQASQEGTLPRHRLVVLRPTEYLDSLRSRHAQALRIKELFSRKQRPDEIVLTEPSQKTL